MAELVRHDLIRHNVLLIDCGESLGLATDYKPTRLAAARLAVNAYIHWYFVETPISALSIVIMRDGAAEALNSNEGVPLPFYTASSAAAAATAALALRPPTAGLSSFNAGLRASLELLRDIPRAVGAEIVFMASSLTSHDSSNPGDAVKEALNMRVTCSVMQFGAASFFLRKAASDCGGRFDVPRTTEDAQVIAREFAKPVPALLSVQGAVRIAIGNLDRRSRLCHCHAARAPELLSCANCSAVLCSVPAECPVCGLMVVRASQVYTAAHHLQKAPQFEGGGSGRCRVCAQTVDDSDAPVTCTTCGCVVCRLCQDTIVNSRLDCPGCGAGPKVICPERSEAGLRVGDDARTKIEDELRASILSSVQYKYKI